jgi:2-oxo-4-hydroxy-4-carboxy-5-ureidoimidazoline decarboxylase
MDPGLVRFNGLAEQPAREALRACCAASTWIDVIEAGRPFADREALQQAARAALQGLDWNGIREALDAHPRVGQRMAAGSQEASWSATEQSGMDTASAETRAALVEANRAYEERFGHVFLIFATGKTDAQLLAAARERVHHDVETERQTVRAELSQIVMLRLSKMLDAA